MKDTEHFFTRTKAKHRKVKIIRSMLVERIGEEKTSLAFQSADRIYSSHVKEWGHLYKKARLHTEGFIFPNIALYRAMQEHVPASVAEGIIEASTLGYTEPIGRKLDRITRIPGASVLFMKLFGRLLDALFGEEQGFKREIHVRTKDEIRLDILECPYWRYYSLLGCPELCKCNCVSDEACYGHMKRIEFKRMNTLGRGGELCDFSLRRVK